MNYYIEAIKIITSSDCDFRALVIEIAKHHPQVVVESAALLDEKKTPWLTEVDALLHNGEWIQAIKLWRAETGLPLKKAKSLVDARSMALGIVR